MRYEVFSYNVRLVLHSFVLHIDCSNLIDCNQLCPLFSGMLGVILNVILGKDKTKPMPGF